MKLAWITSSSDDLLSSQSTGKPIFDLVLGPGLGLVDSNEFPALLVPTEVAPQLPGVVLRSVPVFPLHKVLRLPFLLPLP